MPFQPCTNTIEVAVHGITAEDLDLTNVFHIHLEGGAALDQAAADSFSGPMADFYDDIKAYLCNTTGMLSVTCTDLRTEGGPQFESTTGFPVIGTAGGGVGLPNPVAAVVSWGTGVRGRSFRGRTYVGGWDVVASGGQELTAGALAALQASADGLIADINALSPSLIHLAVLSRFHDNAQRAAGVCTNITTATARRVWGTIRERRPGS